MSFKNHLKSELRFLWFGVVLRGSSGGPPGLCGFSPVVDLRMVFLCLVLGSCGVSGFFVVFLESVFGELLKMSYHCPQLIPDIYRTRPVLGTSS